VRDNRPASYPTPAAVWFAYSENRKGEHPRRHLKGFKGALQADAYSGLHHLYDDGNIYEVSCWSHARRKFHDIHVVHARRRPAKRLLASGRCTKSSKKIRGKPADLRRSVREARAKPLLDDLHRWMEKTMHPLSKKSETALFCSDNPQSISGVGRVAASILNSNR
jgi:transposase